MILASIATELRAPNHTLAPVSLLFSLIVPLDLGIRGPLRFHARCRTLHFGVIIARDVLQIRLTLETRVHMAGHQLVAALRGLPVGPIDVGLLDPISGRAAERKLRSSERTSRFPTSRLRSPRVLAAKKVASRFVIAGNGGMIPVSNLSRQR
jgi:hypothetical protein